MRNLCSSKSARNLKVCTIAISSILIIATGQSISAEEANIQHAGSSTGQSSELAPQILSGQPPVEISPEIAALYERYGAYCDAIVDEAREQRYAIKHAEIETMARLLQDRIEVAKTQSAALEKWVRRREDFAKQATAKIVEIYANMRPEASATRLQKLDVNLAASILLAISPRQASPILNEMDEKTAATITAVMAASARAEDPS